MSERKEKIETKGAYARDLHEAIRDVRRAFANDRDLPEIDNCLNALRDICAPEIRKAINGEWERINEKYHDRLERINNAEFVADPFFKRSGWVTKYGRERYQVRTPQGVSQHDVKRIAETTRRSLQGGIWDKILHERFRVCIDCLDRHGELRKWREVEYGKI